MIRARSTIVRQTFYGSSTDDQFGFDGGSLEFDYLLRPGPVKTSNALALMKSIGLDVEA